MDEQINNFAKTRQYIISRIGAPAAQGLLTQALYFVAIGANDIFSEETSTSHDSYLDNLISKFKSQLTVNIIFLQANSYIFNHLLLYNKNLANIKNMQFYFLVGSL